MNHLHTKLATLIGALAASLALVPAAQAVAPSQEAVAIVRPVAPRVAPRRDARAAGSTLDMAPITGDQLVLPVVRHATTDGADWLQVRLPARSDQATGWVPATAITIRTLQWRIVVSLGQRRTTVYRNGRAVRRFSVVVGARNTPTPTGEYFVVERMRLHDSWARHGWALATSAYSNVLRHFDGGEGQIALHARGFLSEPLGSAGSHGCVRLADAAAAWLARSVPDGTPLTIRR